MTRHYFEFSSRKWMQTSYDYWDDLRKSRDGPTTGVIELSGYIFSSQFPDIVKVNRSGLTFSPLLTWGSE